MILCAKLTCYFATCSLTLLTYVQIGGGVLAAVGKHAGVAEATTLFWKLLLLDCYCFTSVACMSVNASSFLTCNFGCAWYSQPNSQTHTHLMQQIISHLTHSIALL